MCLNHPETIPPSLICGKILFRETSPWCQKGWGLLSYTTNHQPVFLFCYECCREPAWGIPPVTRSCGRKPDKMQGCDWLQGSPLEIPEHPPPKTRICLLYYVMLSTYSSVINRGLSPHHLFLEKVNLELLDNKSPGHKSVSIQKPLWRLSSLPDRFIQTLTAAHVTVCGLLTVRGTGSLKHPRNVGASEESKSLEQDWLRVSLLSQYLLPSFHIFYL